MFERLNKTLICSVVFLDIVEYSRQPVTAQMQLKEAFNGLLSSALQDIAVNDRIIIDTGDGAAICFLGDPEDALFVAISLRDAVKSHEEPGLPRFNVRIGINLGPAKLVKDINGRPNLLGDGINSAERIMSFAEPGYILVSRSYFEVVSCLSNEYAQLFQYEGSRTDKHVREHEVYQVGFGELARRVSQPKLRRRAKVGSPAHAKASRRVRQIGLATTAVIALLGGGWLMLAGQTNPEAAARSETTLAEPPAIKPGTTVPEPSRPSDSAANTAAKPAADLTAAVPPTENALAHAALPPAATASAKHVAKGHKPKTTATAKQAKKPPCPTGTCWPDGRSRRDR